MQTNAEAFELTAKCLQALSCVKEASEMKPMGTRIRGLGSAICASFSVNCTFLFETVYFPCLLTAP